MAGGRSIAEKLVGLGLAMGLSALACGGRAPPDGQSGGTSGDPADRSDVGPRCAALLPRAHALESYFEVSIQSPVAHCPPPVISLDGDRIALGSGGKYPIGEYRILSHSGGWTLADSTFAPGADSRTMRGEVDGFSGLAQLDGGIEVRHFDGSGATSRSVALRAADPFGRWHRIGDQTVFVAPDPRGGRVIVTTSAVNGGWTRQIQRTTSTWELSEPVVIERQADVFPGYTNVGVDWMGNLLITSGDGAFTPSPCPSRWYSPTGGPLGPCGFYPKEGGTEMRPLADGLLVELPYDFYPPTYYWQATDPVIGSFLERQGLSASSPPNPQKDLTLVRGRRAYASWGVYCYIDTCFGDESTITLSHLDGAQCPSFSLPTPGAERIVVGSEGTVVQQLGCSYRIWRHLLQ